jgi:hypothetical protein
MYKETTYGELMHRANVTDDTASKDFLRKCFQGYCKANGLNPLCAETVIKWQSEKVILGGGDNMPKIGG